MKIRQAVYSLLGHIQTHGQGFHRTCSFLVRKKRLTIKFEIIKPLNVPHMSQWTIFPDIILKQFWIICPTLIRVSNFRRSRNRCICIHSRTAVYTSSPPWHRQPPKCSSSGPSKSSARHTIKISSSRRKIKCFINTQITRLATLFVSTSSSMSRKSSRRSSVWHTTTGL